MKDQAAAAEGGSASMDATDQRNEMTIQELRVTNEDLYQQNTLLQQTNCDLREMIENLKQQLSMYQRQSFNQNDSTQAAYARAQAAEADYDSHNTN